MIDLKLFLLGKVMANLHDYDALHINKSKATNAFVATVISINQPIVIKELFIGSTSYHALAIQINGDLYSWGNNSFGQLGDGSTTHRPNPINISSCGSINGKTITTVSCGNSHTVTLDSTGSLHAWGIIGVDQHGKYYSINKSIHISSYGSLRGKTITSVSCGAYHTVAIDNTGQLHAWEYNLDKCSISTARSTPESISSCGALRGKTITHVSCGSYHTVALDRTGGLYTWD